MRWRREMGEVEKELDLRFFWGIWGLKFLGADFFKKFFLCCSGAFKKIKPGSFYKENLDWKCKREL